MRLFYRQYPVTRAHFALHCPLGVRYDSVTLVTVHQNTTAMTTFPGENYSCTTVRNPLRRDEARLR